MTAATLSVRARLSAATITVTATNHPFNTGDVVALSGIGVSLVTGDNEKDLNTVYNGVFQVTKIDANTFSFVLSNTYFNAYYGAHTAAPTPVVSTGSSYAAKVLSDAFSGRHFDLGGWHDLNSGAYTFDPDQRRKAQCFAKCWAEKTGDAVFMGTLSDLSGSPLENLLGLGGALLPASPFSGAGGDGWFGPNGLDWTGVGTGVLGRIANRAANAMGAGADRAALRRLWKASGRSQSWQDWRIANSGNIKSAQDLAGKMKVAGEALAAASLVKELINCFQKCEKCN